jgi:hypothetical protein
VPLLDEESALAPRRQQPGQAPRLDRDALLDPHLRDAVAGAEAEDEPLGQPLPRRQGLVTAHRTPPGFGESAVPLDRFQVDVAHTAQEARGARPEPEVFFGAPVDPVVGRPPPGPRVVGDLVMLVVSRSGGVDEAPVLLDHRIFRRQPLHSCRVPEATFVEGEGVGGKVVGFPLDHAPHRRVPGVGVKPGQAINEVGADVVEPRRPRGVEGTPSLPRRVQSAERREDPVVEALDAQADAVHPGSPIPGEALAGHAVRIALDGDLGSWLHGEASPEPSEDRRHRLGRGQRRRSAADEHAPDGDGPAPGRPGDQIDLPEQRREEPVHGSGRVRGRVERAIAASLDAEGQVEVDTEPLALRRPARHKGIDADVRHELTRCHRISSADGRDFVSWKGVGGGPSPSELMTGSDPGGASGANACRRSRTSRSGRPCPGSSRA